MGLDIYDLYDEIEKEQPSVAGKIVPDSDFIRRKMKELEKAEKELEKRKNDPNQFIQNEKKKGKSAGHIYLHQKILETKRRSKPELPTKEKIEKCLKLDETIDNIFEKTTTFKELQKELDLLYEKARKITIAENYEIYDAIQYCYDKQYSHMISMGYMYHLNGVKVSKSAYDKYYQAERLDYDINSDDSFSKLDLLLVNPEKHRKPASKHFKTKINDEKERLYEMYSDLQEQRFDFEKKLDANGNPVKIGDEIYNTFGVSGLQKGKSVSEKVNERFMKLIYGSLYDLSYVTNLEPENIGLGVPISQLPSNITDNEKEGKLHQNISLSVGARGQRARNALAFYEKQVLFGINNINIALRHGKYGNGSLAHEWGHALDYKLGQAISNDSTQKFSDMTHEMERKSPIIQDLEKDELLIHLRNLRHEINDGVFCKGEDKWKGESAETKEYLSGSTECFARAFESYVDDTLSNDGKHIGMKPNRFLVFPNNIDEKQFRKTIELENVKKDGESDSHYHLRIDDLAHRKLSPFAKIYPQGEERKTINHEFNIIFNRHGDKLKKLITTNP